MPSRYSRVWIFATPWTVSRQAPLSVHGIALAGVLEWVAIPSSRGSSWPKDRTHVSYVSSTGWRVLYHQPLNASYALWLIYLKHIIFVHSLKLIQLLSKYENKLYFFDWGIQWAFGGIEVLLTSLTIYTSLGSNGTDGLLCGLEHFEGSKQNNIKYCL